MFVIFIDLFQQKKYFKVYLLILYQNIQIRNFIQNKIRIKKMMEQNIILNSLKNLDNSKASSLTHLNLKFSNQIINDQNLQKIHTFLRLCKEIRTLILDFEDCSLQEKDSKLLLNDLPEFKNLETLQINFNFNKIKNGAKEIAQFLLKCQKLNTLQIYLTKNQIKNSEASDIIKSIETMNSLQHLEIEFEGNNIEVDSLTSLKNTLNCLQNKLFTFKIGLGYLNRFERADQFQINDELLQSVMQCLNA
ncbi:kinase domain protein, partial (macronuclear) [Tetrahymena thermophila SB210]